MLLNSQMSVVSYSLEQLMIAASKGGSLVVIPAPVNTATFGLIARPGIRSIGALKGKWSGVGQIGDATYKAEGERRRKSIYDVSLSALQITR